MAEQVSKASEVYKQLLKSRKSSGEREKLDGLWKALEAIQASNNFDFSIANVGRNCKAFKGPRTQSIRNSQGKHFRELVDAFAAEHGGSLRKQKSKKAPLEEALSSIQDKALRLEIELELTRGKRLQHSLDELSSAFKQLSANPREAQTTSHETPNPSEPRVSEMTKELFNRFLSSDWLDERMWEQKVDGSIIDTTSGMLVVPPGFCIALHDLIDRSEL